MRGPAALLLAIVVASGCASSAATSATAPILTQRLAVTVTALDVTALDVSALDGPLPSDAAPVVTVTLHRGPSELRLPGRYLGALPFDGAVIALDADGELHRFAVTDQADDDALSDESIADERIAEHVASIPVVSPDGAHLAYVVSEDQLTGSLRVLDAMGDRAITTQLGSIGTLSFSPDGARVAFVGVAARGGIAGVWIADARGIEPARCLTNCDLEVGDLDRAIPLPADALRVEHQRITWTARDGAAYEVPR